MRWRASAPRGAPGPPQPGVDGGGFTMDRDQAREDLVLLAVESRARAAQIRARLDHSHFADHAPLVMLIADYDLHHPQAPPEGPPRRESLLAHVDRLVGIHRRQAGPGRPPGTRGTQDPRWALAVAARADLYGLAAKSPSRTEIDVLVEAFSERRRSPREIPNQQGPNGPHRRSSDRRP